LFEVEIYRVENQKMHQLMRVDMYKKIVVIAIAGSLLGCFATRDLLRERGALPDDLHRVASSMTDLARKNCIKITGYQDQSKDNWIKGRKLDANDWVVRRFYIGDKNWFKVEGMSQGMIDNFYYNKNTFQFICGEHTWGKFSDASQILFSEYGVQPKLLIKQ
jgi:hypothetical protein